VTFYLTRKKANVFILLEGIGGVAKVVRAHHAIGVIHTDGMDSKPAEDRCIANAVIISAF